MNNKGQLLLEVIIALVVMSMVAAGLIRVSTEAVKDARFAGEQSKAKSLAQKKISEIIDYENKSPEDFWGGAYTPPGFVNPEYSAEGYCLLTQVAQASLPTDTPDYENAKMAQINVLVFWEEEGVGSQCNEKDFNHSLNFDTYVTN